MILVAFASFWRFGMIPSYVHIFLAGSCRVYVVVSLNLLCHYPAL
jgi:hypothetical protein